MPSHSEGLGIWLSVWRFLLTHCLYERAAKVLARLRGCYKYQIRLTRSICQQYLTTLHAYRNLPHSDMYGNVHCSASKLHKSPHGHCWTRGCPWRLSHWTNIEQSPGYTAYPIPLSHLHSVEQFNSRAAMKDIHIYLWNDWTASWA